MPDYSDDYTPDFMTPGQIQANRAYAHALMQAGQPGQIVSGTSGPVTAVSPLAPFVQGLSGLYGRQQMNQAGEDERASMIAPNRAFTSGPVPGEPGESYLPGLGQARNAELPQPGAPTSGSLASGSLAFADKGTGETKGSWFGNFQGQNKWVDKTDSGLQASGVPTSVPGIALPNRATLGQLFDVTTPDGRTFTVRQTDLGPAKWTGRGVDVNSAAAELMGYTPKNFPTDGHFTVKPHQGTGGIGSADLGSDVGKALAFNGPGAPAGDTTNDPQQAMATALARGGRQPSGPQAPPVPGRVPTEETGAGPYVPGSFFMQRQPITREQYLSVESNPYASPALKEYVGSSYINQYQPVERKGPFGWTVARDAQGREMWIPPEPHWGDVHAGGVTVPRAQYPTPGGGMVTMGAGGQPVTQGPKASGANVPPATGYDIGGGKNDIGGGTPAATPKPQSQAEPEGKPVQTAALETGTVSDAGSPGLTAGLTANPPTAGPALANKPPVQTAQATESDSGSLSTMTDQQLVNFDQKQALARKRSEEDLKTYSENLNKYQSTARDALTSIPQIELAEKLFNNKNLIQGPWADFKQGYNNFFTALNASDQARVSTSLSQEVDKLVSSGILSTMRQTLGGLGQIRLAEIQLLNKASASRYNTPEVNASILFLAKRLAQRSTDIGQITRDYDQGVRWDEDGKRTASHSDDIPTSAGQNAAIATYMKSHPTLTGEEENQIEHMLTDEPHTRRPKTAATTSTMPTGTTADDIRAELARRQKAATPAQ